MALPIAEDFSDIAKRVRELEAERRRVRDAANSIASSTPQGDGTDDDLYHEMYPFYQDFFGDSL